MGSYTYIDESDVVIKDLDNLKKLFKEIMTDKIEYSGDAKYLVDKLKISYSKSRECYMLDFEGWDGHKIISYWYDNMVELLRDIAVFVEGDVSLTFETQEEGGRIEFENGECIIHTGQMNWHENSPEELGTAEPMDDWIQNIKVAKKI